MSDFLDSLLKGHFKQAELIQPRLLSLFEPPSTAAEARDQHDVDFGQLTVVPAVERQTSQDVSETQRSDQLPPVQQSELTPSQASAMIPLKPDPKMAAERPVKSTAVPTQASPVESLLKQAKPQAITPNTMSLSQARSPLTPDTISIQQNAAGSSPREGMPVARVPLKHVEDVVDPALAMENEAHTLRHQPAAQPMPAEEIIQPQSASVLTSLLSRLAASWEANTTGTLQPVSSSSEAPIEEATRPTTPIVIAPQSHPTAILQPDRAVTRSAPPVVRVTIGRVEVHAIMPPQPAPHPTPTRRAAPLSLDKYLKQVNGRRE